MAFFTTVCKYVELIGLYLILLDDPSGLFPRYNVFFVLQF